MTDVRMSVFALGQASQAVRDVRARTCGRIFVSECLLAFAPLGPSILEL